MAERGALHVPSTSVNEVEDNCHQGASVLCPYHCRPDAGLRLTLGTTYSGGSVTHADCSQIGRYR